MMPPDADDYRNALIREVPELSVLTPEESHALMVAAYRAGVPVLAKHSAPPPDPYVFGLVTADESWYINTRGLAKDVLWRIVLAFAAIVGSGGNPLTLTLLLETMRAAIPLVQSLSPDEGDVAATLARMVQEARGPVLRSALEAAYAYDSDRDGVHTPIDAGEVIDRLLDRKVFVAKAGGKIAIEF